MSPRVAVVGPGAIGTVVAAALHEAGTAPLLCGRTPREDLRLTDDRGTTTVPGPVRTDPAAVSAVDLVLLSVKATQLAGAAEWLRALCRPDTIVCVLENGVEQVADVAPIVAGGPVVPAVVWFPAESQPDGSVRLRGEARLTLPVGEPSEAVVAAFHGSRVTVEVDADFTTVAWRKLLQNAVAGLMALTGRRAGMFRREDVAALATAYLAESLAVARAEGARLDDDVPAAILDRFRQAPEDLGTSILADRQAGRPMEWSVRNGVIQRRARRHGLATPVGDVVVPLLAAASDGPG